MRTCPECNDPVDNSWPHQHKVYCKRSCYLAAYRRNNHDLLNEKSREWAHANRSARLSIQRRWNNSEKGLEYKRRWHEAHISERTRRYLARYHTDEMIKVLQNSRQKSRTKLIRSGAPRVCNTCGTDARLHCHHIDWNPLNRELSNLEWQCVPCHALLHSEAGRGK